LSPQIQRPLPPYLQITQHFRDQIKSGELKDGDRLPSARQLVEQWGVAHATAAKVLATLRSEGLVLTTSGGAGGTVVDVREVAHTPHDRISAVRRTGRIYPPNERARIVAAELITAPEHVIAALGLAEGAAAIRRQRITYRDDSPISASTSWYPGDFAGRAPALLRSDRIKQGTPRYIEECIGRRAQLGRDQVAAATATASIAKDLMIAEGSAVLIGRNWFLDEAGDVVEYGEHCSVADHWHTYEYEIG
jgi:DNA-binding GntR family transcriptional regulator